MKTLTHPLLEGYPVVIKTAVAWGEMDAFQHVNNIVYFRYFENVRIAYSEQIRLLEDLRETGIGPILASTGCKYRVPLTYPDTLFVGARTVSIEQDRITMHYAIVSDKKQRIAAEGDGIVVMYNYREGQKTGIPDKIRQRIMELERL